MKIDKPVNENYAAVITKIRNIVPLENCDNIVGTTIFGLQAIVSKETRVGDLGVFFPAETQLSEEQCLNNNLYRHSEKNKNKNEKGYIEDNRRVKAVKFRGHPSSCLFAPLQSLEWTGIKISDLREGDTFDNLKGKEICRKYVLKTNPPRLNGKKAIKRFIRVDEKFMPEHVDTANFFRNIEVLKIMYSNHDVVVTQKLHGTSIRIGNTIVKRKLNILEWILKKFGVQIKESEYDYVYASRKVIKDINNPHHNHFYSEDIWTRHGSRLKGMLPENYLVFGEVIGFTEDGSPIQADYTYDMAIGTSELYIYRVAVVNPQGLLLDLSWEQIKEFCKNVNLNHVPEIWKGKLKDLNAENFLEKRFFDEGLRECLSLGDNKDLVDEGVCIRIEKLIPSIFKAKSQGFLQHETKLLDKGVVDMESSEL